MKRFNHYQPTSKGVWTGRVDDPTDLDSYRWHQLVERLDFSPRMRSPLQLPEENRGFCFLGYCCDRGVEKNLGRVGTAAGPAAIRKELANLPRSFDERKNRLLDAGDIFCPRGDLERTQRELSVMVREILNARMFPIVLGGGHDVALGHFNGILDSFPVEKRQNLKIGIINFDAHFDLRPYERGANSGSMFLQIADRCGAEGMDFSYFCLGIQRYGNTVSLFKKAGQLGVDYVLAKDIDKSSLPAVMERLSGFMRRLDYLYVTVCADVFSSAYAPGVSAPQPFGLQPETVLTLLKHILGTGKVKSFDIAEVSPRFDEDNQTAKLAAIVIFALVNTLAEEG